MVRRLVYASLAVVLVLGCRSADTPGRIMSGDEDDLVGARSADAPTFARLIDVSLTKLLTRQGGEVKSKEAKVAFVALENKSAEELGDWQAQIEQVIETVVENSERYRLISRRYVETALRELRFRPDELFLPAKQRQFAQILERDNQPVDFLLYAVLTSGTTLGAASTQRDYRLNMELTNVRTGDTDREAALIRKEYTK